MKEINKETLIDAFESAANFLVHKKEEVNELNVFPVPDGDTGTNMSMTVKSAIKQMKEGNPKTAGDVAMLASRGALMGARGNSGVILSQLFRGFSESVKDLEIIDVQALALALKKASEMTYLAVMKPTEGTILTVGREAADYGLRIAKKHKEIIPFAKEVLEAANKSLENTPNLLPVLKEAGVVDAGGKGLCVILEGAILALEGKKFEEADASEPTAKKNLVQKRESISTDTIAFGYCTEFIVTTEKNGVEALKEKLTPLGDSLLVVGDDKMIKVHVHTNDPGKALQFGLEHGFLKDIKIDNMRLQHEEILFTEEQVESTQKEEISSEDPMKKYGFVAVSSGEGIEELFKNLGVDYVVTGGQTMNPSTEDLLEGVRKTNAENVFILPNNSNIIMAANAAKVIAECNVMVIESKSIPQGVSACLVFNEELDPEENFETMVEAIGEIKTAQVTYAVRDTDMNGVKIHKDDFIGISGKDILFSSKELKETTLETIKKLIDEDTSLLTIYSGMDTKEEEVEELMEEVEELYDDIDVEIVVGKQPIYFYLLSAE
ncbi:DAK2 domain-containing protein [Peptoniphilus sp. KCTC 25270]|uniref:DAK2 domain-containing protein n=1 Tax=Peptoniphilus sp. KCTC 25270 TaxID=2897414 RepID=UPI001E29763B|nr:DAK2 domain-containing protein [Peptoniphilus sp. KCTC 25270]MCD1147103.1 DAK2 domain-containing protein [Peptoniphilus sp. KCTC 25270]